MHDDGVRTLWLLRHAKSSWHDASIPDHDRPLAARGEEAARRIRDHLRDSDVLPDLVLCSAAVRTRQTLDAVRPALDATTQVLIEDGLYGADADDLLDRLRVVDPQITLVLLIGHNPGIQDLAIDLAGDGDEAALTQLHTKFPTAALATLELGRTGWADLRPDGAFLRSLVLPRDLAD